MATQVTPRSAPPPTPRSHARKSGPSGFRNWIYRVDVKGSPYAYISPFFLLYAFFGLIPAAATLWVSLHDWELKDLLPGTQTWVGLANYERLWADEHFWNALRNTFLILLLSTLPQMFLALLLASILNMRIRGNTFWRMSMLLPNVASVVAVGVIFSQLFGRDYGLINWSLEALGLDRVDWIAGAWSSKGAIALMITWKWTGYNALIFLAAMQAIPGELYESARLDGATAWQQMWKITVPMIRPTVIFVMITSVIYGMQIFAEPEIFGGGGINGMSGGAGRQFQTVVLYLYEQMRSGDLGYPSAIAYALFAVIIVVTAVNYLIVRRIRSN